MEISPKEKRFNILPLLMITKYINPLTEEARKTFEYSWESYYTVTIGWLWWRIEI